MPRKCTECGKMFTEGFYVEDCEYYCSENCLHKNYTDDEFTSMYVNNQAFWTTWEEDDE